MLDSHRVMSDERRKLVNAFQGLLRAQKMDDYNETFYHGGRVADGNVVYIELDIGCPCSMCWMQRELPLTVISRLRRSLSIT